MFVNTFSATVLSAPSVGIFTSVRLVQPENAFLPSDDTPVPIEIEPSEVQFLNALAGIDICLVPKLTDTSSAQLSNAVER